MFKRHSKIIESRSPGMDAIICETSFPGAVGRKEKKDHGRHALPAEKPAVADDESVRSAFREVQRILIKMPNWLGDAVMSLPAVECVRRLFPHARIECLIKDSMANLIANEDAVDAVISYDHGRGVLALKRKAKTIRQVRYQFFDMAVLLTNSFESALWMFLAGIPLRVGYNAYGRGFLLTHPICRKPFPGHQIRYYLDLCKALGEAGEQGPPKVQISSRDREWAEDFLNSIGFSTDELMIGLCPGAAYGPAKMWLPGRFIQVGRRICENYHARFIVFGGKGDLEPCATVAQGIGQSAINLCGKTTLRELAGLMDHCSLLISNDSGPMHLAAAIGTHVIAIFGSTDPARTAPPENCTVIRKHVPCSPCFKRQCPTDLRCMTSISAEEVYDRVSEILFTSPAATRRRKKNRWMP